MRLSHALPAAVAGILLLLTLSSSSAAALAPGGPPRKILMKDVTSLILRSDMYTTGRRSAPVKQSVCVEGPCQYAPLTALCKNSGFDGSDVVWSCEAELPNEVRFGDIAVSCEGFDYPDDPFILEGSCGLEYQLRAVDRPRDVPQQQQQQQQAPPQPQPTPIRANKARTEPRSATDDIVAQIVAWIFIIAILCCIVCAACHGIINGDDRPSSSGSEGYVYTSSRNNSSSSSSSSSSSGSSTSTAFGATKRR